MFLLEDWFLLAKFSFPLTEIACEKNGGIDVLRYESVVFRLANAVTLELLTARAA